MTTKARHRASSTVLTERCCEQPDHPSRARLARAQASSSDQQLSTLHMVCIPTVTASIVAEREFTVGPSSNCGGIARVGRTKAKPKPASPVRGPFAMGAPQAPLTAGRFICWAREVLRGAAAGPLWSVSRVCLSAKRKACVRFGFVRPLTRRGVVGADGPRSLSSYAIGERLLAGDGVWVRPHLRSPGR